MKKRKRIYIIISVLAIAALLLGVYVIAASSTSGFFTDWGNLLNSNARSAQTETIYAQGIQSAIMNKDIEQAKNFYILSGMDENTAQKQAVDYVMKRDALYQAAIENGYEVTDQEVQDYIEELKVIISQSDNREDALNVMEQFPSEEAYWEYEFTVYKINLPIQNYVHDVEQAYKNKMIYSEKMSPEDAEAAWQNYFESLKENLVRQQNYQVISQ